MTPENENREKAHYGQLLFALGNHIEERGWRDICILEVDGGVIVQGTGLVSTREGYQYVMETKLFSHDELAKMMKRKK
jgi:hypothetical protein